MPSFSEFSKANLKTAHPLLQLVFNEVISIYDCRVTEGYRGQEKQDEYYEEGTSHLRYPYSNHNMTPTLAVDVVPYPIDWEDRDRFFYLAGIVMGVSSRMCIELRWGGDWDRDFNFKDQKLYDLPHYEIVSLSKKGQIIT